MQTVTSCFIRKVKLYLRNVLRSFHTNFHNKTKFKNRWFKSVRYCVLNFSYFEHIYLLFSFQISKKYLCDTYKAKTQSENC